MPLRPRSQVLIGLFAMLGGVLPARLLARQWRQARIAALLGAALVCGLLGIQWQRPVDGPEPLALGVAICALSLSALGLYSLHTLIIVKLLHPSQQAKYTGLINAAAQLGRSLGPLFATQAFALGDRIAPGTGAAAAFGSQLLMLVVAVLVPALQGASLYSPHGE